LSSYISDYGVTNPDPATIERGPKFTIQPIDRVYEPEDEFGLTFIDCRADSYPAASYYWFKEKDGTMIQVDPAKEKRYTVTNGRLMITDPTSTEDDGLYQCRAFNDFGFILSDNAKLSAGCTLPIYYNT